MEYDAGTYQKLPIKQYAHREMSETAEGRYWSKFQSPLAAKQAGAVVGLEFCPAAPHNLAVTSSVRVLLYDGATRTLRRTINRFKDRAYGASWRADGKLLVAGGEDALVQVFDVESRSILRQLRGHRRPVHVTRFDPDRLHVLSGGDDATVRWWDVTSGKQVSRWDGHTDYVRAAAPNPAVAGAWATAGYDHVCKIWDARSAESTLSVNHGAPVEAVAFMPSGSLLVTAGGTQVRVWDLLAGGREIACLANHQKTVTSLAVSGYTGPTSSAGPRLLTGSLDSHLKVYDMSSFKVTHIQKYTAPILSVALSRDGGQLAVGLADGTLTLRQHTHPRGAKGRAPGDRRPRPVPLTADSYRYFIRGQSSKAAAEDSVVQAEKRASLARHDRLLRKFQYREALDAAVSAGQPAVVASVLEELVARGGLATALGGRTAPRLRPLLRFVRRTLNDPRHTRQLVALVHVLLDLYGGGDSLPAIAGELALVLERVRLEVLAQEELMRVQGMLGPLLASAVGHDE